MWVSERKAFQIGGKASAKALRWESDLQVRGDARGPVWRKQSHRRRE